MNERREVWRSLDLVVIDLTGDKVTESNIEDCVDNLVFCLEYVDDRELEFMIEWCIAELDESDDPDFGEVLGKVREVQSRV